MTRAYPIAPGRWRAMGCAYGFDAAGVAIEGTWPQPLRCVCRTCAAQGLRILRVRRRQRGKR